MPTPYDHWKTTDPADDGSEEEFQRIVDKILEDPDRMAEIIASYDPEDVSDWFEILADGSNALGTLALGTPIEQLPPYQADAFARLIKLADECKIKRDTLIDDAAQHEFDNPPQDDRDESDDPHAV